MGVMMNTEMTGMVESSGTVNWLLIGIIVGSAVLGIIVGILLGRKTMKKRDI